jgi:hypothetical protein
MRCIARIESKIVWHCNQCGAELTLFLQFQFSPGKPEDIRKDALQKRIIADITGEEVE